MKIESIELTDVGKFEHLLIKPRALTILSGQNGEGKSTVLKALTDVLNGGHDPSIIRAGTKKATVVITIDDGTIIKKSITPKGYNLVAETSEGVAIPSPASFVKNLASGFALDPVAFVEAGKRGAEGWKQRQKFLQEAIPTTFKPDEITAAGCTLAPPEVQEYDIAGIDALLKDRYERRKAVNAKVESCQATITMLTRSLPGGEEEIDWETEANNLSGEVKAITDAIQVEVSALDKELSQGLEELLAEYNRLKTEAIEEFTKKKQAVRDGAAESLKEKEAALAVAKERAGAAVNARVTKENIGKVRGQVKEEGAKAMALDRAVQGLTELKKKKLDSMPIPGLEIKDGKIYVDGLEFDSQLNTQKQYETAIRLAALAPGELGAMVCDRSESLDNEHWEDLMSACKSSGFQVFLARVTSGPLKVETVNAPLPTEAPAS